LPSASFTTRKASNGCGAENCLRIDGAYPTCDAARRVNGRSSLRSAYRFRLFQ